MKKLIVFMLAAVLCFGCFARAEEGARKTDFPNNTFEEMEPSYITGVTQRGKRCCSPIMPKPRKGRTM